MGALAFCNKIDGPITTYQGGVMDDPETHSHTQRRYNASRPTRQLTMDNDQLFLDMPALQAKHSRKRGMPGKATPRATPVLSTNDLTQTIMKYIRGRGGYAVRINCTGTYDVKTGHWRKSTTEPGTADIHACIRGKHVSIEVKNGDDTTQSPAQKACETQVRDAGGSYLIVSVFAEFHQWYHNLNKTQT